MRIRDFILGAVAVVAMASCSLYADIVLENNFDGVADDTGPMFQLLDNAVDGNASSFDATTGVVSIAGGILGNGQAATNAAGFNNVSLAPLASDVESITATFVIDSVDNVLNTRSNGFFIGLATGAGATDPSGAGLFNNTAASVGLRFNSNDQPDGPLTITQIITEGATGDATSLQNGTVPAVADVEDGFTFVITLNNDGTVDASTTGLTTEIALTGGTLADPSFADFLTDGVGVTASFQGGGGGLTVDSVTVHTEVIPEPSSLALLGLASLGLVTRRRRFFKHACGRCP